MTELSREEREILEAFERGELRQVEDVEALKEAHRRTAVDGQLVEKGD